MRSGSSPQRYLPGIIGGLGPLAHIEFERRLLQTSSRRGARCDQDHVEWVLVSASRTPDRTEALLAGTDACVAPLVAASRRLARAGADFAVVPCNTAHAFRGAIERESPLPWLDFMTLTTEALAHALPAGAPVAILATSGTLATGLYHEAVRRAGCVPLAPALDSAEQATVMAAIDGPEYGVKATGTDVSPRAIDAIAEVLAAYAARGASAAIAGCTELSVIAALLREPPLRFFDPLDLAAAATLDAATGARPLPQLAEAETQFQGAP